MTKPMPEGLATGGVIHGTMTTPITITMCEPPVDPIRLSDPCVVFGHIWAWLRGGGKACGRCGLGL